MSIVPDRLAPPRRPVPALVRWVRLDLGAPTGAAGGPRLGPDELVRMASMRSPAQRERFRTARWLLRAAVAEAAGCSIDDVDVHQRCARCGGPHGRPTVTVGGGPGPSVSLAHSGHLAVAAVSSRPVGVDVERWPAGGATGRVEDLRGWVRTEAVLKATGYGLEVDPSQLEVREGRHGPALVRWEGPGRRPVLQLADLALPGALAAVARAGRRPLRVDLAPAGVAPGWTRSR